MVLKLNQDKINLISEDFVSRSVHLEAGSIHIKEVNIKGTGLGFI